MSRRDEMIRRLLFVPLSVAVAAQAAAQPPTLRSEAVVDLSFDEAVGAAEDRATTGAAKDAAQPVNGASRVASPFWNARAGRAARLDAAATQFFQVADSTDLDHPAGTTLSFFFLNLHELTDATFRGIVAKREANGTASRTNYGLNFQPSSGRLQVYVHDGSGFKVVGFPIAEAFGVRRLVHLTVTFRPGDAPEPDADADADDLELRLHVNGGAIKPQDAMGGPVLADAGWITDVNVAGMLSDAPLTVGASFPNSEGVSGLIDEFLVFNRALSRYEASHLFAEIAGPDAERLAKLETEPVASTAPVVTSLTPRGLQIGTTTRLTITGQNLAATPRLSLPGAPVAVTVLPESTSDRLVADLSVPNETSPTIVPLSVRTDGGISAPVPLPVDRLPQRTMPASATEPVEFPAAFTGTLNGTDRPQIGFEGKTGQRFVAAVELKRLGGAADPVLELKSETGAPIVIAWGRSERGGDARLVTQLPYDGRYLLELHDLAFQAPASPFRLLVGDLRLVDAVLPMALGPDLSRPATAVGPGVEGQSAELVTTTGSESAVVSGPVAEAHGALPVVPVSDGRELDEVEAAASPVDLTSSAGAATYISGRLAHPGESDRFQFRITPGAELDLKVDAKSIGSPVDPTLTVLEGGKELGRQAAPPGRGAVDLKVTPQSPDAMIEVRVSDRLSADRPGRLYRLRVAPAGTPLLRVTLLEPAIVLPRSGRGVTRLRVERRGGAGPVRLIPDEASGVVLNPDVIPRGKPVQEVFVTVAAAPGREIGDTLSLTAEAESPYGTLRRPALASPGDSVERFDAGRPWFQTPLVAAEAAPAVELVRIPPAAFKGVTDALGLKVSGAVPEGYAVRFSLVSDEPQRPNDPNKPAAGMKPRIRLAENTAADPGVSDAVVPLISPSDVEVSEIHAVVKAEVVPHAWSDRVVAIGYSAPFQLAVGDAIAAIEPVGSTAVKAGENSLRVAARRAGSFNQPIRIELRGLPEGFQAPAVEVPAGQTETTIVMTAPASVAAGPIASAELVVLGTDGAILKSVKPFAIEVQP